MWRERSDWHTLSLLLPDTSFRGRYLGSKPQLCQYASLMGPAGDVAARRLHKQFIHRVPDEMYGLREFRIGKQRNRGPEEWGN